MFEVKIKFETQEAMIAYFSGQGVAAAVKADAPQAAPVKASQPASSESRTGKGTTASPKAVAAPSEQAATPAPDASSTAAAEPTVDYATLQKAVFALANASAASDPDIANKKKPNHAAVIAKSLNVNTFKELSQDQWGDALNAVNEKLESLKVAA